MKEEKEYLWLVKILWAKQKGFKPTKKKDFERLCGIFEHKDFNSFYKDLTEDETIKEINGNLVINTKKMWNRIINNDVGFETDKLFHRYHIGLLY